MSKVLKVFATKSELAAVTGLELIADYPAFCVARATPTGERLVTRRWPTEDITAQYQVPLASGTIDTSLKRYDAAGKSRAHPAYRGAGKLDAGPHHYLVQFVGPIKPAWLTAVKKAGGKPRGLHSGFAYVFSATESALQKIAALPCVRWVGHLPHAERLALDLRQAVTALPRTRLREGVFTIEFFDAANLAGGRAALRKLGVKVLGEEKAKRTLVVEIGGAGWRRVVEALSKVHGVRMVQSRAYKRTANDVAARLVEALPIKKGEAGYAGLTGAGEIVAVCDTGFDSGDTGNLHPDFAGRIKRIRSYPISPDYASQVKNPGDDDGAADFNSGHGTHVAGSVLGDGQASNGAIRGLAYKARLVFQAIEQEMKWRDSRDLNQMGRYVLSGLPLDLGTLFADAYRDGARVHTNSWGGGAAGDYDDQCRDLDRFVHDHRDMVVLFAAGNDGTDQDRDGAIDPTSVASPGTAKNCITVGASESLRPRFKRETYGGWWSQDYPKPPWNRDPMADNAAQVAAFSSRGPTRDGRFKPEVVAPGTFILSTRSRMIARGHTAWGAHDGNYFYMGGTSMATPITAGLVTLIREHLRRARKVAKPSAALIKAVLINGAQRLKGARGLVDNTQGFGRVSLEASLLANGGPRRLEFCDEGKALATGSEHTRDIVVKKAGLPLAVTLAYTDFPGERLVNNLNLVLTSPAGRHYAGNGATLNADTANNVEKVRIARAAAGIWKVRVIASNVPEGRQNYALAWSGAV